MALNIIVIIMKTIITLFVPRVVRNEMKWSSDDLGRRKPPLRTSQIPKEICLWDTYPFEGASTFIPTNKINGIYSGFGKFCSFECAYTYLMQDGMAVHDPTYSLSLLYDMYNTNFGKYPDSDFELMPHRCILKKYASDGVNIEDYRKSSSCLNYISPTFPSPIIKNAGYQTKVIDHGTFTVRRRIQ